MHKGSQHPNVFKTGDYKYIFDQNNIIYLYGKHTVYRI
jgi:hypothetical protein